MKKFLPLLCVLGIISILLFFRMNQDPQGTNSAACEKAGGQWSEEFRECLGIDAASCQNIGGKFDECASACRNTQQDICTLQCVQVCEIR